MAFPKKKIILKGLSPRVKINLGIQRPKLSLPGGKKVKLKF